MFTNKPHDDQLIFLELDGQGIPGENGAKGKKFT